MKTYSSKAAGNAFTVVELLVVIGILALLALLLIPATDNRPTRAPITHCLNNLRQIDNALQMFASDNNSQFPPQVSITNGGSLEFIGSNSPALHYRTLSNYVGGSRSVWHCPADQSKQPLTNKSALTDRNLSYFISVDATGAMTNVILAGDRNLEVQGRPMKPGLFPLTSNATVSWTRELHSQSARGRCGNLLLVDAHAATFRAGLLALVRQQGLATNHLAVP